MNIYPRKKKRKTYAKVEMIARGTNEFCCLMCPKEFKNVRTYRIHAKAKHGIHKTCSGWRCPYANCDLCFPKFGELSNHGLCAHRDDVMDGEGPIYCDDCESCAFSNEACYIVHKRKKHKTKEVEIIRQISGCHQFQEYEKFPSQHKFGEVYFEKRVNSVYSESLASFWSSSTFVTMGKLNDGTGGGGL